MSSQDKDLLRVSHLVSKVPSACTYYVEYSLFRKKRFMLDEKFQGNASKLKIRATLFFPLMNALVYADIDQGTHYGEK